MSFSPLDSALYGRVFSTPELRGLFSDAAHVARMVEVEVALARSQASLELIPPEAADAIAAGTRNFMPDMDALAAGLVGDGVPVVALLAQLRPLIAPEGRDFLHYGATTQDIVDTALVLALRDALNLLEADLRGS
ncbi:lyase family protein, partial [Deinococcus sp.]|uniref:lyase family protein n=1 Tax=Deinococcus sp. TaxID=47478 RepID=UPI0028699BAA